MLHRVEQCTLHLAPSSSNTHAQFRQLLRRFRHPNIIVLYGYNFKGSPEEQFLVYEHAAYNSLAGFFRDDSNRACLPADIRLSIMFELAIAVNVLHTGNSHGWKAFHRDIKSANICLTEDFTARLTGFGVSECVPDETSNVIPKFVPDETSKVIPGSILLSTEGDIVGTRGYMCPEYVYKSVSGWPCPFIAPYDVFSIGAVMAELILGRLTFGRVNVFQKYVMNAQTEIVDGWKLLRDDADGSIIWNPKVLQIVCNTAIKCMAPSPSDRFRTNDLLDVLMFRKR